jgi:hypothetical protein
LGAPSSGNPREAGLLFPQAQFGGVRGRMLLARLQPMRAYSKDPFGILES